MAYRDISSERSIFCSMGRSGRSSKTDFSDQFVLYTAGNGADLERLKPDTPGEDRGHGGHLHAVPADGKAGAHFRNLK